jgi:uncharacterized surface protein with fasciclin (FAS1) repeats
MATIVEIASSDPRFTILAKAVTEAGLVEALSGEGPFTVFAPTNEAFEQALIELDMSAEELFSDKELLSTVLKYHVVSGKVMSTDLSDGMEVKTLIEDEIEFEISEEGTLINGESKIIDVDIEASNGIIHVIDTVLIPEIDADEENDEEDEGQD